MDGGARPAEAAIPELVAQDALAAAVRRLCRGGSWEALPQELAWLVVKARGLEFESIEPLALRAEEQLGRLVDEATEIVAESASWSRQRHLARHPADEQGAVHAASVEAEQEARRVLALVYLQVLEAVDHSLVQDLTALEGRGARGRVPRLPGRPPLPPPLVSEDVRSSESGWGSMVA